MNIVIKHILSTMPCTQYMYSYTIVGVIIRLSMELATKIMCEVACTSRVAPWLQLRASKFLTTAAYLPVVFLLSGDAIKGLPLYARST